MSVALSSKKSYELKSIEKNKPDASGFYING